MRKIASSWMILLVAGVLVVGVLAGYLISRNGAGLARSGPRYAAVYLQTGDIYYGRLHFWPSLYLEKAWYVERDAEGQPQIVPYEDLFWGPGDRLYLNRDHVAWWTYLKSDSELLAAFEKAAQQNQPTQ